MKNELISQSGFTLETSEATKLRSALLGGDWPCATSSLDIIAKREKLCEEKLKKIKYYIAHQHFLELLETGDKLGGLKVLRKNITSLGIVSPGKIRELSTYLMLQPHILKHVTKWPGAGALTRERLLKRVQTHLPAHVLLPPGRLDKLLDQAKQYQITEINQKLGGSGVGSKGGRPSSSNEIYQNSSNFPKNSNFPGGFGMEHNGDSYGQHFSHLLSDINENPQTSSRMNNFPSKCVQTLTQHCDEVVHCAFSNNGKHLATCSKDESIKIWRVDEEVRKRGGMGAGGVLKLERSIQVNNAVPAFVKFSPDDKLILVCSDESINGKTLVIELENASGARVQNILLDLPAKTNDNTTFNSGDFSADSKSFVIGGLRGQFERHTSSQTQPVVNMLQPPGISRNASSEILPGSTFQTPTETAPLLRQESVTQLPASAVSGNSNLSLQEPLSNIQTGSATPLTPQTPQTPQWNSTLSGQWVGVRVRACAWLENNRIIAADNQFRIQEYKFRSNAESTSDLLTNPLNNTLPANSAAELGPFPLIKEEASILSMSVKKYSCQNARDNSRNDSREKHWCLLAVERRGIRLWELESGTLIRSFYGHQQSGFLYNCCFGQDFQFIAAGSDDRLVSIWHVGNEKTVKQLEGHDQRVNCVAWSGDMLVSVSDDRSVKVWM